MFRKASTDSTMRMSPHGLSRAGGGDKEPAGNAPGLDDDVLINIPAIRIEEASQVYGPASANESRGYSRNSVPTARYQSCQSRLSIREAGQTGQAAGDEMDLPRFPGDFSIWDRHPRVGG